MRIIDSIKLKFFFKKNEQWSNKINKNIQEKKKKEKKIKQLHQIQDFLNRQLLPYQVQEQLEKSMNIPKEQELLIRLLII